MKVINIKVPLKALWGNMVEFYSADWGDRLFTGLVNEITITIDGGSEILYAIEVPYNDEDKSGGTHHVKGDAIVRIVKAYFVFNEEDGITASPDIFTKEQAMEFIKNFPKRYEAQGYYKNNRWEKIDPKDVKLTLREYKPEKPEFILDGELPF